MCSVPHNARLGRSPCACIVSALSGHSEVLFWEGYGKSDYLFLFHYTRYVGNYSLRIYHEPLKISTLYLPTPNMYNHKCHSRSSLIFATNDAMQSSTFPHETVSSPSSKPCSHNAKPLNLVVSQLFSASALGYATLSCDKSFHRRIYFTQRVFHALCQ